MREYIPYILAIAAGAFTALEVSINTKLGKMISPPIATLHSLITGVLFIFVLNLFSGNLYRYKQIFKVNPIWLIGGIFGALIIYLGTKTVPKLGITVTLILIVSAEVLTGLFIDSFLLKEQVFGIGKFIGLALILIGIYVILE